MPPCLVPSYRHRPMMNSHRAFFIYRRILNEQYRNQHRHLPDCQKADRQDNLYRACAFQPDRQGDDGGQNQASAAWGSPQNVTSLWIWWKSPWLFVSGSARVVKSIYFWSGTKYFKRNTADFHKDGYFLQNAGVTKDLRIAFVVCDVNSEQKRLQVKIFVFEKLEGNLTIWRLNWLYAIDQKQKKNGNNAQIQFLDRQNNFLLPLWEPVSPLCAILRAKSR